MPDPLVTLTTDFGNRSPYAAALKGVLLATNPAARLLDLSHEIPPQDVRHAAFFLAEALPWFPPGTLHVVIVDPGVGSSRAILHVRAGGQQLLVPDNGCWTLFASRQADRPRVVRVENRALWLPTVSATFHGRDVFAPVAGHLSRGFDPAALGPPLSRPGIDWVDLPWPAPTHHPSRISGEVVFVDDFGNLITNVRADDLGAEPAKWQVSLPGSPPSPRRVRTYADAPPGQVVWLTSSGGFIEIAVVQGNAARSLGAKVGTPIHLQSPASSPS